MWNLVSKLLDRVCVVVGALIFIQAPLFMQQYHVQLVGRVDELTQQVDVMQQVAMESNKTLDQFIQKFVDSKDFDFSHQGRIMKNMIERWRYLSEGLLSIEHASLWIKPMIFLQYIDYPIAQSTFSHYQFGIILTYEGLVYALLGICAGYSFYLMVSGVVNASVSRIRKAEG